MMRLHPDAVTANVAIGRITEAKQLTEELDASMRTNAMPWATAMAGRCHGLLYATQGDLTSACAALDQALVDHQRLPMPFEEARTRLLFGTVLLRAGHRRDARRELEAAQGTFLRLGAPVQAGQAHRVLSSIGGRAGSALELTSVESRVAALASDGRTNREVADTLFMSVRTVESHLGRIYRKLGLRSRTELARRLPAQPPPT